MTSSPSASPAGSSRSNASACGELSYHKRTGASLTPRTAYRREFNRGTRRGSLRRKDQPSPHHRCLRRRHFRPYSPAFSRTGRVSPPAPPPGARRAARPRSNQGLGGVSPCLIACRSSALSYARSRVQGASARPSSAPGAILSTRKRANAAA